MKSKCLLQFAEVPYSPAFKKANGRHICENANGKWHNLFFKKKGLSLQPSKPRHYTANENTAPFAHNYNDSLSCIVHSSYFFPKINLPMITNRSIPIHVHVTKSECTSHLVCHTRISIKCRIFCFSLHSSLTAMFLRMYVTFGVSHSHGKTAAPTAASFVPSLIKKSDCASLPTMHPHKHKTH